MKSIVQQLLFETPKFDRVDGVEISITKLSHNVAKKMVVHNHYSHTMPQASICLGFVVDGCLNGVIVYGHGVNKKVYSSIHPDMDNTNSIELVRLYSHDWAGKNMESRMIGMSFKYLREYHPEIKMLLSFADETHGHVGTIYQATNWIYTGKSLGGHMYKNEAGELMHPRTLGHDRPLLSTVRKEVAQEYDKIIVGDFDTVGMCAYLNECRKKKGISVKWFDKEFGYKDTAGHWFRTDKGRTLPSVDDWFRLKAILNMDDRFDYRMKKYKYRKKLDLIVQEKRLVLVDTMPKHRYVYFLRKKREHKRLVDGLIVTKQAYP